MTYCVILWIFCWRYKLKSGSYITGCYVAWIRLATNWTGRPCNDSSASVSDHSSQTSLGVIRLVDHNWMSSNDAVIVTANCVLVNRAVMLSSGQRLSADRSVSLCWRDNVCDGWRGCWSVVIHTHWTCEGVISVARFLCRFPGWQSGCVFCVVYSMLW